MTSKRDIENYALSLLKHGLYKDFNSAFKEATRFFRKCDDGFVEPMLCPHRPDIEMKVTDTKDGQIVTYYTTKYGKK